jgi:cell division septal protein FtsQ
MLLAGTLHLTQRKHRRFRRLLARLWFMGKCLMGFTLCVGLAWGGSLVYRLVRDAEYFRLRQVHIVGNKTLSRREVLYLLALPPEVTSWQLDLARMGARLERHPYVRTVSLRRRLPDTLTVTVQERAAFLVAVSGWQHMVIDDEGVVLRPASPQQDSRLPRLELRRRRALTPGMHLRYEEAQRALELVRAYTRSPVAAMLRLVSLTVEDSGASVWHVEPYAFAIRLGEGGIEAQLRRLPPVLRYIVQQNLAVRRVDVSYRKRVVVTLGTS